MGSMREYKTVKNRSPENDEMGYSPQISIASKGK